MGTLPTRNYRIRFGWTFWTFILFLLSMVCVWWIWKMGPVVTPIPEQTKIAVQASPPAATSSEPIAPVPAPTASAPATSTVEECIGKCCCCCCEKKVTPPPKKRGVAKKPPAVEKPTVATTPAVQPAPPVTAPVHKATETMPGGKTFWLPLTPVPKATGCIDPTTKGGVPCAK